MRYLVLLLATLSLIGFLAACGGDDDDAAPAETSATPVGTGALVLTSSSFEPNGAIPPQYTCDGEGISPPLDWNDGPSGTAVYAVEVLDPTAGGFVHWIIYNIPSNTTILPAGVPDDIILPDGSMQAINAFGQARYGGPCPPDGESHQYVFTVYALDAAVPPEVGGSARNVQQEIAAHTLGSGVLPGVYSRVAESERSATATPGD